MKKLISILILILVLSSCGRTVTIVNNNYPLQETYLDIDGTMYDCTLQFFDKNDNPIQQLNIGHVKPMSGSKKIKVPKRSDYFKILFSPFPEANIHYYSFKKEVFYLFGRTYLDSRNTRLILDDNSQIGSI